MIEKYIDNLVKEAKVSTRRSQLNAQLEKQAAREVALEEFISSASVADLAKIAGIELPEETCGGCGGEMQKIGSSLHCACGKIKAAISGGMVAGGLQRSFARGIPTAAEIATPLIKASPHPIPHADINAITPAPQRAVNAVKGVASGAVNKVKGFLGKAPHPAGGLVGTASVREILQKIAESTCEHCGGQMEQRGDSMHCKCGAMTKCAGPMMEGVKRVGTGALNAVKGFFGGAAKTEAANAGAAATKRVAKPMLSPGRRAAAKLETQAPAQGDLFGGAKSRAPYQTSPEIAKAHAPASAPVAGPSSPTAGAQMELPGTQAAPNASLGYGPGAPGAAVGGEALGYGEGAPGTWGGYMRKAQGYAQQAGNYAKANPLAAAGIGAGALGAAGMAGYAMSGDKHASVGPLGGIASKAKSLIPKSALGEGALGKATLSKAPKGFGVRGNPTLSYGEGAPVAAANKAPLEYAHRDMGAIMHGSPYNPPARTPRVSATGSEYAASPLGYNRPNPALTYGKTASQLAEVGDAAGRIMAKLAKRNPQ